MRRVVKVSTRYTGSKRHLGKWVKPKKYVVHISEDDVEEHGKNKAIYMKLKKKPSLARKDFAWWKGR